MASQSCDCCDCHMIGSSRRWPTLQHENISRWPGFWGILQIIGLFFLYMKDSLTSAATHGIYPEINWTVVFPEPVNAGYTCYNLIV